jgi:membrane-associated phospholipid phosphatase
MFDLLPVAPDSAFACSKKGVYTFICCFLAWVVLGGILLLTYGNLPLFKWVHTHHVHLGDIFFRYYTAIGTAVVIIPVLLALFWYRYRNRYFLLLVISTQIGSLLINQAMKFAFAHARPVALYGDEPWFHYISGEVLHRAHSFPSGHTAGAFAFAFLLSLLSRSQSVLKAILLCVAALLVAYSRMYLGQHFFTDIYVGSIEGVVVCTAVLLAFYKAGYCRFI